MKSLAYVLVSPIGVRARRMRAAGLGMAIAAALCGAFAPVHAAEDSKRGGIIRYGHYQEPGCLYAGWVQAGYIQRQYADNLVARDHDGRIVPWLATDWTIAEDNLTYVFKIKPGVTFHDGTVLDAKAIVTNFDRWALE